jgi:hypothetical protein
MGNLGSILSLAMLSSKLPKKNRNLLRDLLKDHHILPTSGRDTPIRFSYAPGLAEVLTFIPKGNANLPR